MVGKGQNKKYPEYGKLGKIHYDLIESFIRPGMQVREIYNEWQKRIRASGIKFRSSVLGPHIGHSIGTEVHEYPMINAYNEQALQPKMVMNLEPCFHHEGRLYHVEDTFLVTNNGCEILTNLTRAEELYEIA